MFYNCNSLSSSPDVSERDISQVKGKNKTNAERRPQFIISEKICHKLKLIQVNIIDL